MATIHKLPGPDVRAEIATAIKLLANGKWRQQQTMSFIAGRLEEYGLTKLNINNYSVRIAPPVETVLGIWPVVIIEAREVTHEPYCPACKSEVAGYLAGGSDRRDGGYDQFMLICRDCGCIYQYKGSEVMKGETHGHFSGG